MRRIVIVLTILVLIVLGIFVWQYLALKKAHSTFENYYAFRGCVSLVSRTSDSGTCKLASGQTIKIVQFNGKWYLDGDLPACGFGFCI